MPENNGSLPQPKSYVYDKTRDELLPTEGVPVTLETYEQGRIHRLRDDLGRQLDMLGWIRWIVAARTRRAELEQQLNESAKRLAPLLEEREQLAAELTELPKLQED